MSFMKFGGMLTVIVQTLAFPLIWRCSSEIKANP
jgi:hypothetical protein